MGRIRPAPSLAAAVLSVLVGCQQSAPEPEGPTGCPEGEQLDGEVCVPLDCGLGEWGDLPALAELEGGAAVWVATWGDRDWSGTIDQPFDRIEDAALAVTEQGGGLVLVASGVYDRNLSLGTAESLARIVGRCAALTVVDGHGGEEPEPAVAVVAGSHSLERLTIRGGLPGVEVLAGFGGIQVALRDVVVTGSTELGVLVAGNARVDLEDVEVSWIEVAESGLFGRGIDVESGGLLTGRRVTVQDVASAGVYVAQGQARVELEDSVIRRVRSTLEYHNGEGVSVLAGGQAALTGVLIEQTTTRGVSVFDADSAVELTDCTIRDIDYDEFDGLPWEARGLYVDGGQAVAGGLEVSGTWMGGVVAQNGGLVELQDSLIQGDRGVGDDQNGGIAVALGGRVVGARLEVAGNEGRGVQALGAGSEVVLTDSVIRDTLPLVMQGSPAALSSLWGGSVVGSGLEILDTTGVAMQVNDAEAVLEDSWIARTFEDPNDNGTGGVAVSGGGYFEGRRLLVQDTTGPGLSVMSHGSLVILEDIRVEGARPAIIGFGSGLDVSGDARAEVHGLEVADCQPLGVHVTRHVTDEGAPTLILSDAAIDGTPTSGEEGRTEQCLVSTATAGLELRDVELSGCTWAGLEVADWEGDEPALLEDVTIRDVAPRDGGFGIGAALISAPATVRRLHVEDVYSLGLLVAGEGTVTLEDSTIRGVKLGGEEGGGVGLAVQYLAFVDAVGLLTEDNAGPGVYALAGGWIDCLDCVARRNGFAGAAVTDGGVLRLTGGSIEDSRASLVAGGGVGVFGWQSNAPPRVSLTGVEILDHAGPAVYLRGRGAYVVEDSVLDGNGLSAGSPAGSVLAIDLPDRWDPLAQPSLQAGLVLSGNRFADEGDAVLLHASTVTLTDNQWEQPGDGLDVRRQACEGVLPPEVLGAEPEGNDCEGPAVEVAPPLDYRLAIEEAGVEE